MLGTDTHTSTVDAAHAAYADSIRGVDLGDDVDRDGHWPPMPAPSQAAPVTASAELPLAIGIDMAFDLLGRALRANAAGSHCVARDLVRSAIGRLASTAPCEQLDDIPF